MYIPPFPEMDKVTSTAASNEVTPVAIAHREKNPSPASDAVVDIVDPGVRSKLTIAAAKFIKQ